MNPDKVKCILCGKEFSGGVHRLKLHIAHKKNVDELEEELGTLNTPHFQGPMDGFSSNINREASLATQKRQQSIHDAISKEKTHDVRQYCSRWVYHASIPFNAIENDAFRLFCEAMGQFGPGWIPPNSWTEMKRKSIMNLCVNSRGGTCFLSSKDTSKYSHTSEHIFKYIDMQVVTDNATNNVSAAKMLKEKRPTIFWSGCAAHTLDLMLEGVSKLPNFHKVIILKIFSPLVKVLRMADGEKIPSMGFVFATRILALTSSSSGCERNWRCFESVSKKIRDQNADAIFEDGNEDTVGEWIVGPCLEDQDSEANFILATQTPRVRDIYDDDFESEPEDAIDMEFEPVLYQEAGLDV
ncbi:hypothetical protein EUTSA_v10015876mg [Eutrema salsugineum]|uniref:DUF659 domain-containing protein n=1 Tax=Eutrema salsugineum TaxID=72664 RepID=V4LIW6_EUTSA|nr:hypothetical protein EUTSA_v10015876mg [Eutrema salsugineum]